MVAFISKSVGNCPASYTQWATTPHAPFATGSHRIPSMRPAPECRTFSSSIIEQVIRNITEKIQSPEIRQLFINTMPNTLDTAIAWHHRADANDSVGYPYTFVITGDINAQWTRDSTNQMMPIMPYVGLDPGLRTLVAGLVNMQAEQIADYAFANAYKPPARSGLVPGKNSWAPRDRVVPGFNLTTVFEAKFEIDSLAAFLKLSTAYWRQTKGMKQVDTGLWSVAVRHVLDVVARLQKPTFGKGGELTDAVVEFSRAASSPTESSFGNGRGNPVRATGMVRSLFRPSDDSVIFPFFVPGNAMLAVELANLAEMLSALGSMANERDVAQRLANEIRRGIMDHATVEHPQYGRVFAFEVDGYGGRLVMDDANVPSLLSLPYLGFVSRNNSVYVNTRRLVLSTDNPWYFEGDALSGVGSPHTGFRRAWPMAVAVAGLTSDSRMEVAAALDMLVASTAGLGLMHESVDVSDPTKYSRPWFAWCNGVVSELIMYAVDRFPGLI
ncbi:DUF1237 domain-containing protein [Kickxella alabastrina]|uniref:DUF1237 domain-containing protein n=1 Tax=Kickxella alabastrina TaxID=61397 RepID=UPI00221FDC18|nr:DUF1237 domain-containing protein [Kickxella alabastrina]KAI7822745.1 DUF1237 domain-containing protein [Kickxella alabastrina]